MKAKIAILAVLVALVLSTLACGSSSTGSKVGETGSQSTTAPAQVQTFKVGDLVAVGQHTIVLNSATVNGNVLKANFTIENKGTDDMAVSSLLSFTAKDSEGTKLETSIMDCGSDLGGKVLPGDKTKGDVCWSGATNFPIKIYYEDGLFSSGATVWEIQKP
jgi:hypothetical protein